MSVAMDLRGDPSPSPATPHATLVRILSGLGDGLAVYASSGAADGREGSRNLGHDSIHGVNTNISHFNGNGRGSNTNISHGNSHGCNAKRNDNINMILNDNNDYSNDNNDYNDTDGYGSNSNGSGNATGCASLDDVKAEVLRIQDEQDRSKTMMDLTRVQPFIEGIEQLGDTLRLFASESDVRLLLGHVWGPMRFLLQTASGDLDAFEKLLGAYLDLGMALPLLEDHARLFQRSTEMQATLADVYDQILGFHRAVVDLFIGQSWPQLFKAAWKDFESRFHNSIVASIDLYRELVAGQGDILRSTASNPMAGAALSAADSQMVSRGVRAYQAKLVRQTQAFEADEARRRNAQKEAVLEWIEATDQTEQTHEAHRQVRARNPHLGAWVLRNEKVARWMASEQIKTERSGSEGRGDGDKGRAGSHDSLLKDSVLWMMGKRGTGKSVLASVIIDECLRRSCENRVKDEAPADPFAHGRSQVQPHAGQSVHTAYFYCSSPATCTARSTHLSILQGLLHQLVSSFDRLLPSYHSRMTLAGHQALQDEGHARALMDLIAESVPRAFLIVDGLDECAPGEARLTAGYLGELVRRCDEQSPGKLRVLVVTGNGGGASEIKRCLAGASVIGLRVEDCSRDLRELVVSRVERISSTWRLGEAGKATMISAVCRRAAGSFVFADLALKYFDMQARSSDVLDALRDGALPDALEGLYHRIISQIKARLDLTPGSMWPKSLDLLTWVMCARRPLERHELRAVLSFGSRDAYVPAAVDALGNYVADLCGPLVRVVGGGDRVELVHASARDYILSHPLVDEQLMQLHVATLCLRYLRLDCFCRDRLPEVERTAYAREGYVAFQDYAATCWADHLRIVASTCAGLFARRPDCVAEFDAALGDFVDAHRLGLQHVPHPDFGQHMAGGRGAGIGASESARDMNGLAGFVFFPKLEFLLSFVFAQSRRPGAADRLLGPQLQTALRENRRMLERLFDLAAPSTMAPVVSVAPMAPMGPVSLPPASHIVDQIATYPPGSHPNGHNIHGSANITTTTTTNGYRSSNNNSTDRQASQLQARPDGTLAAALRSFYGSRPFKCAHPGCRLFYAGFDSAERRNVHHNRHDRPFPCPVNGCANGPFGFQTAKDRDRHVRQYHPHESAQLPPFVQPSRRRRWGDTDGSGGSGATATAASTPAPAQLLLLEGSGGTVREKVQAHGRGASVHAAETGVRLFRCTMCEKSFTRKINLIGHVRSHFGERPFSCGVCGKAFARANDCKRHEKIHARRGAVVGMQGGESRGGGGDDGGVGVGAGVYGQGA